ncbi:MAG: SurA N-terminal domain-containing protein [Patescibacteria group bacterium]|jgi:foldase protein PrsA
MAKIVKKQNSPNVTVKFSKRIFQYALVVLVVVGLIYFVGKTFIAASANGQLISRLSVIKILEKQGGKTTLDTIILKALINQEAKKRKINISENEINTEISKIEANVTSQGTTLDSLLLQQGMTKKDLTEEIKVQLLVTKMAGSNISITDKEIDDYLTGQKEQSALSSTQPAPELTRDQAKEAIKQQKLQEKIQAFVADLKAKAKINYFIKY